jgi:hypothetical protein
MRDPADRPFVDLAATHPTPDFIVTGDKDFEQDHYHGVPDISASVFVKNGSSFKIRTGLPGCASNLRSPMIQYPIMPERGQISA